jgi:hypothetical protein
MLRGQSTITGGRQFFRMRGVCVGFVAGAPATSLKRTTLNPSAASADFAALSARSCGSKEMQSR